MLLAAAVNQPDRGDHGTCHRWRNIYRRKRKRAKCAADECDHMS